MISIYAVKTAAKIKFPVAENVKPVDIHGRLLSIYGFEIVDISFIRS